MLTIPRDAIELSFVQVGHWDGFPDGLLHTKTVPHAILAMPRYGQYEVTANGRTITAGADEAFLSPPQCPLAIVHRGSKSHRNTMAARWLHFTLSLFGSVDFSLIYAMPAKVEKAEGRILARLLDEILQLETSDSDEGLRVGVRSNECLWRMMRIIVEISKPRPMAGEFLRATIRFRPLLSEMHATPSSPFTISGMARQTGMSESQFQHAFRQALGISPMRYLKKLRLSEAAQRLTSTDLTLSEIADAVGYANPFHLSRDFKRQFQLSPRDYRATHAFQA